MICRELPGSPASKKQRYNYGLYEVHAHCSACYYYILSLSQLTITNRAKFRAYGAPTSISKRSLELTTSLLHVTHMLAQAPQQLLSKGTALKPTDRTDSRQP
jgi:hypothetical protein